MSAPAQAPSEVHPLDALMERVTGEAAYAMGRLTVPGLKKVRTSLRRTRSVAEAMELLDPDPGWTALKRQARALFRELGPLRDLHVMREWTKKLAPADDEVGIAYLRLLAHNERRERTQVKAALERFDWELWAKRRAQLVPRAALLHEDNPAWGQLALQRWEDMLALHRPCMREAPARVWHELRKSVKRFRYLLEIFQPRLHKTLRPGLKKVQTALGELNDLDVLTEELMRIMPLFGTAPRRRWVAILTPARNECMRSYRALAEGGGSGDDGTASGPIEPGLLEQWRTHLPSGEDALAAARARLVHLFSGAGPRAERAAEEADLMGQSLVEAFSSRADLHPYSRLELPRMDRLLRLAAVPLATGEAPRRASRALRGLSPPTPYTAQDLLEVRLMLRFSRRGRPDRSKKALASLGRLSCERVQAGAELLFELRSSSGSSTETPSPPAT